MEKEEYKKRLEDLYKFLNITCIEGGCGYDLKSICFDIILGKIDYEEALNKWKQNGHSIF